MISSFHTERDYLNYAPFDAQGGLVKMYQLFGDEMDGIIDEGTSINSILLRMKPHY